MKVETKCRASLTTPLTRIPLDWVDPRRLINTLTLEEMLDSLKELQIISLFRDVMLVSS